MCAYTNFDRQPAHPLARRQPCATHPRLTLPPESNAPQPLSQCRDSGGAATREAACPSAARPSRAPSRRHLNAAARPTNEASSRAAFVGSIARAASRLRWLARAFDPLQHPEPRWPRHLARLNCVGRPTRARSAGVWRCGGPGRLDRVLIRLAGFVRIVSNAELRDKFLAVLASNACVRVVRGAASLSTWTPRPM
ncbi:hypothetical protein B0H10DRAFT_2218403 [Mycena sp. CBHHK59/15]|nr:hypothetical protein B0H10DRAFT_2218403 [Mycena sp. CBHHK59/15]